MDQVVSDRSDLLRFLAVTDNPVRPWVRREK